MLPSSNGAFFRVLLKPYGYLSDNPAAGGIGNTNSAYIAPARRMGHGSGSYPIYFDMDVFHVSLSVICPVLNIMTHLQSAWKTSDALFSVALFFLRKTVPGRSTAGARNLEKPCIVVRGLVLVAQQTFGLLRSRALTRLHKQPSAALL